MGLAWSEFFYPFEFIDEYDAGEAEINFGVGRRRQTIEIAGFEVLYYGSSLSVGDLPQTRLTYAGRAPDAAWRQRAEERIRQHRQGDFALQIIGATGQPVADAPVEVTMQRHAFLFGSALQMWRLTSETAENQTYRAMVTRSLQRRLQRERPQMAALGWRLGPDPFQSRKDAGRICLAQGP